MASRATTTIASDDAVVCPADGLLVDELNGGVGLRLADKLVSNEPQDSTMPEGASTRTDLKIEVGLLKARTRHCLLPGSLTPGPDLLSVGSLGQLGGHLALLLGHGGLGGWCGRNAFVVELARCRGE